MHLFGRHSMDLAFRDSNALKYCDRLLLHPIRKSGCQDELLDLREGATVLMVMFAKRAVLVRIVRVFMMGVMVVFSDSRRIGVRMVVAGMRVAVSEIFVVLPVGLVHYEFHGGEG